MYCEMELRSFLFCAAFLVVAAVSHTEARHSLKRREASPADYDIAGILNDEDLQNDGDTQNDADGGDDEDGEILQGYILSKPETYNVTVGKSVRLECKTDPDSENLVIQWNRNGDGIFLGGYNQINGVEKERYNIANKSHDLIITDVESTDSGLYECVLELPYPYNTSITHSLIVQAPPHIIKFQASDNGNLAEGSDLMLTCNVTGSPPPQLIWSRSKSNGESNERLTEKDGVFTKNSFFIKSVKKQDARKYYCYAINPAGTSVAELNVVVHGKPHVHVQKTLYNSAINISAFLECSVHDEPTPRIYWLKDGMPIKESPNVQISTSGIQSNLTVTPTSDADFGTYTCEAANEYGSLNKSISLVQTPVIEDIETDGPKIMWIVHSHQPLEKAEIQLRGSEGQYSVLEVPLPHGRDGRHQFIHEFGATDVGKGKYMAFVKVKNSHGWSAPSEEAQLEIIEQPQPIQRASVLGGGAGATIRPTSTILLASILMYLLVRAL